MHRVLLHQQLEDVVVSSTRELLADDTHYPLPGWKTELAVQGYLVNDEVFHDRYNNLPGSRVPELATVQLGRHLECKIDRFVVVQVVVTPVVNA